MAEYLLAEVLERQGEEVRRLLLRTSVLERISGPLADLLTGGSGGERILQDLEEAGAFVVSLDGRRSWFRYHQLFADLLQLELRHAEPGEVPALHATAAGWYAGNGYPAEAVRHAQAAQDWSLAAGLLSDYWVDLDLGGQAATARELLTAFPAGVAAADAELTALMAAAELARGSLEEAGRQLALASQRSASVPADRRGRLEVMLTVLRLYLARQRGDLPAVSEAADGLLAAVEAPDGPQLSLGEDLRALTLVNLGIAEVWAFRFKDANQHLEQGVALARRIGRPYLELTGLAHGAELAALRSYTRGAQRSKQAIELARQHGWSDEPFVAVAYTVLGGAMVSQGRLAEGERWLGHAARTLRPDVEPAVGMHLHYARGGLEMARGRPADAIAAFRAARQLAQTLVTPHTLATPMRAHTLQALVMLGETGQVERSLAEHGRWRARGRRDAQRHRAAPAGPARPAGGDGGAGACPGRLRPGPSAMGGGGGPARGDRARRARRPRRRRARDRARPRSGRARPHAVPVPHSTLSRRCSSAMPGTAPGTRPWSLRSSACPAGVRGAGSPPVIGGVLGVVPPAE